MTDSSKSDQKQDSTTTESSDQEQTAQSPQEQTAQSSKEQTAQSSKEQVAQSSKEPSAQPAPAVSAEPQVVVAAPKSGGKGLSIFAILLSLVALGGSAYTWYENNLKRFAEENKLAVGVNTIGGDVKRLGDAMGRLQSEQADSVSQEQLTTRILETTSAFDLQIRDLEQGQKDLLEAVEKINDDMQTGINEFVIDEVSQLLKLANNSALFANDANAAVKALQLADLQLKELADPRFSIVRRKINEEIGQLNNIQQVDIESLTEQLQAVADRVPSLKLENERPAIETIVLENTTAAEEQGGFIAGLKEIWVDLVNFAEVQRIDQPPKPLLTPEHRYFLNQNLQLQLAKAELGVLQKRPEVYSSSLDTALTWLNDYFDLNDASVKQVIEELTALKAQQINVELPPVAASYDLLQSIKGGQ